MGSAPSGSSPNFPLFLNLQWPSSKFKLESKSCPKCLSSPLFPTQHLHSRVGGGGVRKERRGAGATRIQNPQQKTGSRKKNNNQKARSSWGRFNNKKKKKKKKKKIRFLEKRKKRKKFFAFYFSKFCGETSRYWALFSKISKSFHWLQMFAFSYLTGFWKL